MRHRAAQTERIDYKALRLCPSTAIQHPPNSSQTQPSSILLPQCQNTRNPSSPNCLPKHLPRPLHLSQKPPPHRQPQLYTSEPAPAAPISANSQSNHGQHLAPHPSRSECCSTEVSTLARYPSLPPQARQNPRSSLRRTRIRFERRFEPGSLARTAARTPERTTCERTTRRG